MILHDRCNSPNITFQISNVCVCRPQENDVFLNAYNRHRSDWSMFKPEDYFIKRERLMILEKTIRGKVSYKCMRG